ncbi:unnamed protein product [Rhizoctonia solani]|uniref:NACHT domain-containing protein n=1 Tax=Rhizoctonia solani TaxID=456999 RepID=A0A8H2W9G1_9AGAM|nr:unnamed protein product [Rhizoctonia solani]
MSTHNRLKSKWERLRGWFRTQLNAFRGRDASTSNVNTNVWAGLRVSLKTLRDTSAMFPPLVSAASVLLDCFDTIEAIARNQQDYENLAVELDALSKSLVQNYKGIVSKSDIDCVTEIVNGIERQAKEIEKKTERGTGRRMIMAAADEEDLMRRFRRIQSLFRQLQTNLSMSILKDTNELVVDGRLGKLKSEMQATYNSVLSASTNRRTCTEGTRTQVLSELKGWVFQTDAHAVYWMSGMAGTGKTTIACTFAKWLEQERLLAASFFCTRTSADCRNVTRIIPTVAYQLARYSIPFQSALCKVLGSDPDIGAKDITTQFKHLLIDPLQKVKNDILDSPVVVIDALDECDDQSGVGAILDILFKHASQLPVKFFVTSRPEVEIHTRMKDNAQFRAAIYLHDIEKSLVKADVELYLREELAFMGSSLSANNLQELVERSGALFIYAATLVRYIRPATRKADPQQRLRSVLGMTAEAGQENAQIDALYAAVLKSALDDEELQESEKEVTRAVLRTVLFSQEPVPVETIAELSGIEGPNRVEYALNALRSVLHYSDKTDLVSTLHASFPDFMFDKARSGVYHCDVGEHAATLTDRCFMVMRTQLRFNICDLPSSFVPDDKVENMQGRIKSNISPPLSYACRYWANHLTMTAPSSDALAALDEFLSNQLLFWMEVTSLKRELLAGIEALLRIKRWLAVSGPMPLAFIANFIKTGIRVHAIRTRTFGGGCRHFLHELCDHSVYTHYWPRMQGLLDLRGSLMDQRIELQSDAKTEV